MENPTKQTTDNRPQIRKDILPWIPCPHCNAPLSVLPEVSLMYFQGTKVVCPNQKCNKPVDWWDAILNAIKTDFFIATVLAPIGARSTFFTVNLALGELLTIKFDEHGLPKDAKILEVNYTPQGGGLFPLEMHGNTPHRHIISSQVTLYPIPFSKNCPPDDTKVGIFVTWVPKTMDDEAWQNLAESFEAFSQNRYSSSIIPADLTHTN
jgi:hypothetical protein